MKAAKIRIIILGGVVFYILLSQILAFGQTFPETPAIRLGKGTVTQIAYSPDGRLLAVAGSLGIRLYNARNLSEVGLLGIHIDEVNSIVFSPDGQSVMSVSTDTTLKVWDISMLGHGGPPAQGEVTSFSLEDILYDCAWSPDGRRLVVVGRQGVYFLRFVELVAFTQPGKSDWLH